MFAALNAASAWGGALGLATGALSLGPRLEARLPFASPVFAGVALAAAVAAPSTALAVAAARGDERSDRFAVLSGAALLGWIAVQLAVLREFSFFQPVYATVGATLVVAGRRSRCAARRSTT